MVRGAGPRPPDHDEVCVATDRHSAGGSSPAQPQSASAAPGVQILEIQGEYHRAGLT